ncbi:MAG: hypothetical protein II309_07990 [Bacilli bacterium]|nr:hypothetical protein [Bacilli bacterium]
MFNKRSRWENIYLQLLNIEKNKMNDEDVRKMNIVIDTCLNQNLNDKQFKRMIILTKDVYIEIEEGLDKSE